MCQAVQMSLCLTLSCRGVQLVVGANAAHRGPPVDVAVEEAHRRRRVVERELGRETIGEVVALGVDGFVSKNIPAEELRSAVTQVAMGLQYFGADISHIISYVHKAKAESGVEFSERELEIISLCSKGLTVKEIAWNLNLGVGTVNTHKNNIFKKLGINNSVELVLYALRTGIVTL